MTALPHDTHLGAVRLRVSDLERQVAFYRDVLGLAVLSSEGPSARLGTAADAPRSLVVLDEAPGAPPAPAGATGLFHMALLLPSRSDLAAAVLRLDRRGWPLQGWSDHAVSEAFYLSDPEGNGIELYADRPRETWRFRGRELHIVTEPLDVEGLLAEAAGPADAMPEGTVVGHVHLRVSSLGEAEDTYVEGIGFEVMARAYPGALFVSAGGYHHHLGMNVWASRGGAAPPEGSRGLVSWDLVVPDDDARRRLTGATEGGPLEGAAGETVRVLSRAE